MRAFNWTGMVAIAAVAATGGAVVAQRGGGRQSNSVQIQEGQPCPPGMTEVRHLRCQAPAEPAPSIVDYRPRSTVIAPQHLVPRAKYPVVDVHTHVTETAENMPGMIKDMDALNLRVLVNLSGGTEAEGIRQKVDAIRNSPYKDRFRVFANVDWNGAGGPGWKEKTLANLEQAVKNGAIGLKIFKSLGLTDRKADGSRLHVDDPDLDPVWDLCARLNIPVIIHTADPEEFFRPVDDQNERWLELNVFPGRRYPQDRFPSFEELMKERDTMFARHPKTRYIAAHFAWYANDLQRAAKLLDENPNVYPEVAAVLYEFGRQPRASREFFTKYQDRVLFGKDTYAPSEYPYYWRVFETGDEYFDYYRHYHAFWKLYGMSLPDGVLKKLYFQNALKVEPGLPQTGWPE
ncbi:MAG TPA: amidohydrolase family protein [Vicinamibacterales bacterium]|nr:amidohydrolase family protein [Vicinamibacterales bacterium]